MSSATDEALKKLADKRGVFGLISTPGALNGTDRCTVADYVDSIDAAVNLMVVEQVGFGTDLLRAASVEEVFTAPEWNDKLREAVGVSIAIWPWSDGHVGMENNSGYPNLTRGSIAKGYSDEDVAKIMGGNFLRMIEETIGRSHLVFALPSGPEPILRLDRQRPRRRKPRKAVADEKLVGVARMFVGQVPASERQAPCLIG